MATLNFIEALRTSLQRTRTYFDDNVTTLTNNVGTLKSRVDILEEESTISDAELQDIRVGADGTIYESAGEAVRQQVSHLSEEIANLKDGTSTGTGWTKEQIDYLEATFNGIQFATASGASNAQRLIKSLRGEAVDPDNSIIVSIAGESLVFDNVVNTAVSISDKTLVIGG